MYTIVQCVHVQAEWLCVPSGKWMNVGSNPAVGAGFFRRGKLVSATNTEQEWP